MKEITSPTTPEVDSLRRALVERDLECARLSAALHKQRAHPDFEYETTRIARKSGDSLRPDGDGWQPNVYVVGDGRNWERFDFHENEYWMRARAIDAALAEKEQG